MTTLTLIGIGTGNPDHLTRQALREINQADLILIPRKGADKADLADLRHAILTEVLTNPTTRIVEFDLPRRDPATPDYHKRVDDWHDAIAAAWSLAIGHPAPERVALLVWGDPSLYDSSLRIAARLVPPPRIKVVPGLTSLQCLTAAHAIPVNQIGAAFLVTTGRNLADHGWPEGVDTVIVMLDGACAFQTLPPDGIDIWWGAYVGMPQEIILSGPLAETGPQILATRAAARASHGWLMDIYLLRRNRS